MCLSRTNGRYVKKETVWRTPDAQWNVRRYNRFRGSLRGEPGADPELSGGMMDLIRPGTPRDPPGGAGKCRWGEGRLENLLPAQRDPGKSRRIKMDVVHFFKDNSFLQKLCRIFELQKGFNGFVTKKSKRRNHLTVFCLIWRRCVFKLDCSAWFRCPDLLVICLRCVHSSPPCLTRCTCRVSHNNCPTDSEPRQENPVNLIY